MKNNLSDKNIAEDVIKRVEKLKADAVHQWGEMNVAEMLHHCNSCNREIFEKERGDAKTSLGQYLLRILALYIAPEFKKGLKSEPHHIIKGKADKMDFDQLKADFIKLIRQFPENKKTLTLTHPAFGNISTHQWGIAAYKHMDHHLRQFGI